MTATHLALGLVLGIIAACIVMELVDVARAHVHRVQTQRASPHNPPRSR